MRATLEQRPYIVKAKFGALIEKHSHNSLTPRAGDKHIVRACFMHSKVNGGEIMERLPKFWRVRKVAG